MNKLFVAKAEEIYDRLNKILFELTGGVPEIRRTENGKPYIAGDPLFFSISHSGKRGVIAVADRPVGVDLELFKGREHSLIASSFPAAEQAEICGEREFLAHWTAREAYIKMLGGTLAKDMKNTAYIGGNIFYCGIKQPFEIQRHIFDYGIVSVCIGENKE